MARLPYLDAKDLATEHSHLMKRPINLFRALAHNPGVLQWMEGIGRWIRHECTFDPRLRELAILQVGFLAGSPYEFTHHVQIGYNFGITEQDVHDLISDTRGEQTALDETSLLVLAISRQLAEGTTLDDDLWRSGLDTFGASGLLDLVFVVTHYVQVVRVLGALEVDVEPEWEPYRALLAGTGKAVG